MVTPPPARDTAGEAAAAPILDAHRSGTTMWIDWLWVPPAQRGHGAGRAHYRAWEEALPDDITLVCLMAADAGDGRSDDFWDAMGFSYTYDADPDTLPYEFAHRMWKGVHGHATPDPRRIDPTDPGDA